VGGVGTQWNGVEERGGDNVRKEEAERRKKGRRAEARTHTNIYIYMYI
jgi:hypothetical protein